MSDYPHICEPQRQPDGTYSVKVERAAGSFKADDRRRRGLPGSRWAKGVPENIR